MLAKPPVLDPGVQVVSRLVVFRLMSICSLGSSGLDGLDDPTKFIPEREITQLKKRISEAIISIRDKKSTLTITDLKRLLFRAASTLIYVEKVHILVTFWLV